VTGNSWGWLELLAGHGWFKGTPQPGDVAIHHQIDAVSLTEGIDLDQPQAVLGFFVGWQSSFPGRSAVL